MVVGLWSLATYASAQRSVIWQERSGTWSINAGVGPSRYLGDLTEGLNLAYLRAGVATSVAATCRLTD